MKTAHLVCSGIIQIVSYQGQNIMFSFRTTSVDDCLPWGREQSLLRLQLQGAAGPRQAEAL